MLYDFGRRSARDSTSASRLTPPGISEQPNCCNQTQRCSCKDSLRRRGAGYMEHSVAPLCFGGGGGGGGGYEKQKQVPRNFAQGSGRMPQGRSVLFSVDDAEVLELGLALLDVDGDLDDLAVPC